MRFLNFQLWSQNFLAKFHFFSFFSGIFGIFVRFLYVLAFFLYAFFENGRLTIIYLHQVVQIKKLKKSEKKRTLKIFVRWLATASSNPIKLWYISTTHFSYAEASKRSGSLQRAAIHLCSGNFQLLKFLCFNSI